MGKLMRIELLKIRRRPRTWIMAALTVLMVLVLAIIVNQFPQTDNANWKQELIQTNQDMSKELSPDSGLPEAAKKQLRAEIEVNQYHIDHDISPNERNGWKFMDFATNMQVLIAIFMVIIAGDIVSSEFGWGTIKLLLIRPASRTKILYAKYLTVLLVTVLFAALLFAASYLIGGLFFGFNGADQPYVFMNPDGGVEMYSTLKHVLLNFGLGLVTLLMYITMAFMISAAFRSSSMAIAITLLLMLIGGQIVQFLSGYSWSKYILMANVNLVNHIEGPLLYQGMTVGFSIAVLAVYFLIFHGVAWYTFTKRDVAA